jgi:hypothetical protein
LEPKAEVKVGVEPKEKGVVEVAVRAEEDTKVEVGAEVALGSSLLPNIEVPVENAEPDIVKGAVPGEKVVEVGA